MNRTITLVVKKTSGKRTRTGLHQKVVAVVYHRPDCRHIPNEERMDRTWAYEYEVSSHSLEKVAGMVDFEARKVADGHVTNRYDLRACGSCKPAVTA